MKFSLRRCPRRLAQSRGLASVAPPKRKEAEPLDAFGERVNVETYPAWHGKLIPPEVLALEYPTYKWLPWKSSRQPTSFWKLEHCRSFLEWLFVELGLQEKEDFYCLSTKHFQVHKASELYQLFHCSPYELLSSVYPDTNWLPWKFQANRLTWEMATQLSFLCWLGTVLEFKTQEDWYKLTKSNVSKNHGLPLLSKYRHIPSSIVETVYPEFVWQGWFFHPLPVDLWECKNHRRQYLDWLGIQLGVRKASDWYGVVSSDFTELHGGSLLIHVRKEGQDWSLLQVLKEAYPWYKWEGWRFFSTSHELWDKKHNREDYLAWFSYEKGFTDYTQWYKVSVADFNAYRGRGILRTFGNSPSRLLRGVYPDIKWDIWRFEPTPKEFWLSPENRKLFFDRLAEELHIDPTVEANWYTHTVTIQRMIEFGGEGLLRMYNNSPYQALSSAYPDLYFHPWKFYKGPTGIWSENTEMRKILENIEAKMKITNKSGWYAVTAEILEEMSFADSICKAGGFAYLLDKFFPHNVWDFDKIESIGKELGRRWLREFVVKLFPGETITENYTHPMASKPLTIDFFIPRLNLGIEYRAYKHLHHPLATSPFANSPGPTTKTVDLSTEKKKLFTDNSDITFVEVPHWWTGEQQQLTATIRKQRPDLLVDYPDATKPIPETDPKAKVTSRGIFLPSIKTNTDL